MKSNYSPIVLFVYNRPEHTRRTVEALASNIGASDSVLNIYSDAAKSTNDIAAVEKVRSYIRQITGFKQVVIVERAENYGLAKSIIDGVTNLCNRYGRVIVLEDDLETSVYFLTFMNEALDFYESIPDVMHISGYRYPAEPFGDDDTFFLHVPLCWGWATWQRAWSAFKKDIFVMQRFDRLMIKHFDFDDTYPYSKQLKLNKSGKIDTWFVFWYAALLLRGGLSLFPSRSLVRNIGFDNSGSHCGKSVEYDVDLATAPVSISEISLTESTAGYESHKKYFRKLRPKILGRVYRKFRFLISKLD